MCSVVGPQDAVTVRPCPFAASRSTPSSARAGQFPWHAALLEAFWPPSLLSSSHAPPAHARRAGKPAVSKAIALGSRARGLDDPARQHRAHHLINLAPDNLTPDDPPPIADVRAGTREEAKAALAAAAHASAPTLRAG